uniref:Secreted protein n=1 Tax=Romanomermis culicivorax TaxID=13658 RepID=A0A915L1I0_ROMCU
MRPFKCLLFIFLFIDGFWGKIIRFKDCGIKVACLRRQRPGYNCPVKNCLLSYLFLMKKNGNLISCGKQAKDGSYRENNSQKKAALKTALPNALSPTGRCWQNRELVFADMCTYFSLYNFVESPHAGFKCKTRFKNDEELYSISPF